MSARWQMMLSNQDELDSWNREKTEDCNMSSYHGLLLLGIYRDTMLTQCCNVLVNYYLFLLLSQMTSFSD